MHINPASNLNTPNLAVDLQSDSIALVDLLQELGFTFFTGVPDSVLRGFCEALSIRNDILHVPAANEGAAVALGIGQHLVTESIPVIYLQNSGLWNALNPYFTLAHENIYKIPLLFIIGWRGQPGKHDEPQHVSTGNLTETIIEIMGIRSLVLTKWSDTTEAIVRRYLKSVVASQESAALVVPRGVLDDRCIESQKPESSFWNTPSRMEVIEAVLKHVGPTDFVVGGIGHTGREIYASRRNNRAQEMDLLGDFLCVGGMGFAHQIALGAALKRSSGSVWCIDGDGSFLMHMGTAAAVGAYPNVSLFYVLVDNGSHASVGGQPTACDSPDYTAIARGIGFRFARRAQSLSEVNSILKELSVATGTRFLWVPIRNEPDLRPPRPSESFVRRKLVAKERNQP